MSLSPAARYQQAIRHHAPAAIEQDIAAASLDSLHLRLIEFEQDKQGLKGLVQIAEKVRHKRDVLIPKYQPWVERYLAAGESYPNPIFSLLVVWLFDIGDVETALAWLFRAIELNLPTPEHFKRKSWAIVCADSVLEWAEQQRPNGHSVEPYFSTVLQKIDQEWVLPEVVEAKWYKFAGQQLLLNPAGQPQASAVGDIDRLTQARAWFEKARQKHPKIGVKTQIERIDMRLNALNEGRNL